MTKKCNFDISVENGKQNKTNTGLTCCHTHA